MKYGNILIFYQFSDCSCYVAARILAPTVRHPPGPLLAPRWSLSRWWWRWDDGADPDVLETRVTHTRKSRSAFDGYNRGLQWERTCAEVLKLRITRGSRSSSAEQPIAAGSGGDSLHFAAVLASRGNGDEKKGRSGAPRP